MKILVFGAGGQLGSEWRHYFTNGADGAAGIDPLFYGSDELDITDTHRLRRLLEAEQPDAVVNCAAYTAVDRAEEEQEWAERVNHLAVDRMARLCAERDIRLVHYSTDYIFPGRSSDRDRRPDGYSEQDTAEPVNWYGETKWRGEEAIRRSGCPHLIIRVSWLCGPFGGNFVHTMLRLSRERDTFSVVSDQWGSPTYTGHLVRNSVALLQNGSGGTVHITSEGCITWHEFAEAIFELAGREVNLKAIPTEAYPTAATRPRYSKLSTAKLRTLPGTDALHWKEGLRELLNRSNTSYGEN